MIWVGIWAGGVVGLFSETEKREFQDNWVQLHVFHAMPVIANLPGPKGNDVLISRRVRLSKFGPNTKRT